jgi:hypothetical protein
MRGVILLSLFVLVFLFESCSPKVTIQVSKIYPPLEKKEEIKVLGVSDPVPGKSEELGVVRVGDSGFTTNCEYDVIINAAKLEAQKAGGNAIKLIEHVPPYSYQNGIAFIISNCHSIVAKILKVSDFNSPPIISKADSILANADYALLHFYRFSGAGNLISYNLHLGNDVICNAKVDWRKTVKIKKSGPTILWAQTEVKEELPIDIKIGKEYYIQCGIAMGILVGRPIFEVMGNEVGKIDYNSIELDKSELNDRILFNDGRIIECKIQDEDNDNVYFSILINDKEVKTQISKPEIKEIKREEILTF